MAWSVTTQRPPAHRLRARLAFAASSAADAMDPASAMNRKGRIGRLSGPLVDGARTISGRRSLARWSGPAARSDGRATRCPRGDRGAAPGRLRHAASPTPNVLVLPTTGVVDQVMAGYIADGISRAEADGDDAVIIELDTPGGDLFSTNDIVGSELDATIPVIVWVRRQAASRRTRARSSRWPATSP